MNLEICVISFFDLYDKFKKSLDLVEEWVGDPEYNGWEGRTVAGGHLLEVCVVDGVERPIVRYVPAKNSKYLIYSIIEKAIQKTWQILSNKIFNINT